MRTIKPLQPNASANAGNALLSQYPDSNIQHSPRDSIPLPLNPQTLYPLSDKCTQ